MKYLSVCSGIEAATVAWHGLGWEPVAFSEIEAFPAAVLEHHYPTVPNLGDLTKYREWPEELLVEVDLLVGGTPCQAFSVAGLRRSLEDERGNLSLTYVNLYHHINEVRRSHGRPPAIALWENVPGVLSTKDNAFGCFIGGLLGCDDAPQTESGKWHKAGFLSSETVRVGYRVLDAQYFGVAQRRRRVFLAAVHCELVERFGERSCPSEILSLRESVLGNPPTRGAAGKGITSSPEGIAGNVSSKWAKGTGGPAGDECYNLVAFHPTQDPISSTDGSTHSMGCGPKQGCCTQAVAQGFTYSGYSNQPAWMTGDRTDCLPASGHSDGSHQGVGVATPMAVRRLTPRECERLQGFPDDYTLVTYRNKPAADGPRYKALGNSMAVPVMWWLGYRIQKATA